MKQEMVWLTLLAAVAATQVLRLLPVLVDRAHGKPLPPRWVRGLEAAGLATLGSLLALAVFAGPATPLLAGLRLLALGLAFALFLWLRRGLLCLLLAYGAYVLLVVAAGEVTGGAP
jgi:branched-subunit amino acid transport protein